MTNRQDGKAIVLEFFAALESSAHGELAATVARFTSSEYRFRGVHPFNELEGADAVAGTVWQPLHAAFTSLQRRQDVFMAGANVIDGNMWITSMGNFLGLFDED